MNMQILSEQSEGICFVFIIVCSDKNMIYFVHMGKTREPGGLPSVIGRVARFQQSLFIKRLNEAPNPNPSRRKKGRALPIFDVTYSDLIQIEYSFAPLLDRLLYNFQGEKIAAITAIMTTVNKQLFIYSGKPPSIFSFFLSLI